MADEYNPFDFNPISSSPEPVKKTIEENSNTAKPETLAQKSPSVTNGARFDHLGNPLPPAKPQMSNPAEQAYSPMGSGSGMTLAGDPIPGPSYLNAGPASGAVSLSGESLSGGATTPAGNTLPEGPATLAGQPLTSGPSPLAGNPMPAAAPKYGVPPPAAPNAYMNPPMPAYAGAPGYGAPAQTWPPPAMGNQAPYAGGGGWASNTSGTLGDVPPEVARCKWHWGAFAFTSLWAKYHGIVGLRYLKSAVWAVAWVSLWFMGDYPVARLSIFLLACAGYLGISVYAGLKGHQEGWRYRRFDNVEHFFKVQQAWMIAGLIKYGLQLMVFVFFVVSLVAAIGLAASHRNSYGSSYGSGGSGYSSGGSYRSHSYSSGGGGLDPDGGGYGQGAKNLPSSSPYASSPDSGGSSSPYGDSSSGSSPSSNSSDDSGDLKKPSGFHPPD